MEFWGVEVKSGEPLKVQLDEFDSLIHLSQAALGESKNKGNEPVLLHVKVGEQKLVLGTLLPGNIPQLSFDLVFEDEFELSHNWKNGSVYFCGYKSPVDDEDGFPGEDDSESEEELHGVLNVENGKVGKPESAPKPVKIADLSKDNKSKDKSDEDDESSDEDDESDEDSEGDEDEEDEAMSEDLDNEDESDSDDEETPKKVDSGKKRPSDSATKTPVSAKKAKAVTPQKTDGKKGGHPATPHPAKQAGKNAANGKPQTPKSGGQHSCQPCSKSFGSESALQSHNKAKHAK